MSVGLNNEWVEDSFSKMQEVVLLLLLAELSCYLHIMKIIMQLKVGSL